MRRIASVRTSPVYSHFAATVAGASSVRAYGRQDDFVAESNRRIENMQAAKYPGNILDRCVLGMVRKNAEWELI